MTVDPPFDEFVDFPTSGHTLTVERRVGPVETTPTGRVRLDAILNWLQEIAVEDAIQIGLAGESIWLLRKTLFHVTQFPVLMEKVTVSTACTGLGAVVAERRSVITSETGGRIDAQAIWVPVDPQTMLPRQSKLLKEIVQLAPEADNRRVRGKLSHPAPPSDAERSDWYFAQADMDAAGHINNSAYLRAVEEHLGVHTYETPMTMEIEHRSALERGVATVLHGGDYHWLLNPEDEPAVSIRVVV